MAPRIAIAGTLPGGDCNGLDTDDIAKALMDNPNKLVMVVALVTAEVTRVKHRKGTQYPILGVAWWEAVPDDQVDGVGKVLNDAYMARTGAMMAPFIPGGQRPLDETPGEGE